MGSGINHVGGQLQCARLHAHQSQQATSSNRFLTNMPMTRQRAQSSFTVEIKRANRRTPEVLTLNKATALRRSSLADQVFSKVSGRPHPPQIGRVEHPALIQKTPTASPAAPVAGCPEPQAQPSPRRVLPDLLTVLVDPVAELIKQEAQERITRRKVSRKEFRRTLPVTRVAASPSKASASTPVLPRADVATPAVTAEPQTFTPPVQQALSRRWNAVAAKARRAEREGRSMPRLPAGQRWKRRLPKACW
jgi:hypothetical protein